MAVLPTLDELDAAAALVRTVVPPTPQYCWPLLSRRLGAELWLKHENHTPTGAFKLRGGLVYFNGLEQVRVFEKGVSTVEEEPLNYGEFRFEIRDGDIISPRIKPAEPLKNQCRHFLECVRLGKRPVSSGIEGRDVVRVLEAVNRSIEYKGQQVEIERNDSYAHTAIASTIR